MVESDHDPLPEQTLLVSVHYSVFLGGFLIRLLLRVMWRMPQVSACSCGGKREVTVLTLIVKYKALTLDGPPQISPNWGGGELPENHW